MASSMASPSIAYDYIKTNINGLAASYVLANDPRDLTGESCVVIKVLDIPDYTPDTSPRCVNPIRQPLHVVNNFSDTPLHLCDPAKLVTQHRLRDNELTYRKIEPHKYTAGEIEWYNTGKIPPPMRMVMISMRKCYLCGDFQEFDSDIQFESTGEHRMGYNYCISCEHYFRKALFKTLAPIWHHRIEHEAWRDSLSLMSTNTKRPFIWVHRTRYDEAGIRDYTSSRPYRYTKWHIINWVTHEHKIPRLDPSTSSTSSAEATSDHVEDCIWAEQYPETETDYQTINKLVSVKDVFITNLGLITDPNYNPNLDDPMNKYTGDQIHQMIDEAKKTALFT